MILDTGVLVAYLSSADTYHAWAREQFESLTQHVVTCEAVLAESAYLLRSTRAGPVSVLSLMERGVVRIEFSLEAELTAVTTLMRKFGNVPMSLADACLVRMAEMRPGAEVLTLDRDFLVYRTSSRRMVPTRLPAARPGRRR